MADEFTLYGFLRCNDGDIGLHDDNKAEKQTSLNWIRIYYEAIALRFHFSWTKVKIKSWWLALQIRHASDSKDQTIPI
jgi:hypothetical protein